MHRPLQLPPVAVEITVNVLRNAVCSGCHRATRLRLRLQRDCNSTPRAFRTTFERLSFDVLKSQGSLAAVESQSRVPVLNTASVFLFLFYSFNTAMCKIYKVNFQSINTVYQFIGQRDLPSEHVRLKILRNQSVNQSINQSKFL